ncbi:MAG: VOC family protein [Ilumatobacter sp.]|nr:VOC family protein [Ilumatobacter sp.]
MAGVGTYLNFAGNTEEAFEFYKTVFGTDYVNGIMRFGDIPGEGPELSDADKQKVMHVGLPTLGDHLLMGTDALESMGQTVTTGTNVAIMLNPDTHEQCDELFEKLSDGATDVQPMKNEFWGDYYGHLTDKFGVHWMIDIEGHKS